jgi:hypothetical protein
MIIKHLTKKIIGDFTDYYRGLGEIQDIREGMSELLTDVANNFDQSNTMTLIQRLDQFNILFHSFS